MPSTEEAKKVVQRSHQFHAEAHVLSGELHRPVKQKIEPHVPVALKDERGGHLTRFTEDVSIEGLITFKTGHTRVSGSKSLKHQGWVTLTTSVLEGYNVFEVITADRVVSQVSTDHPYPEPPYPDDPNFDPDHPSENGHVPHVTFLGSKFENLQVSGFPLTLTLDLDVCGKKPKNNKSYLEDAAFLEKIHARVKSVAEATFLPEKVRKLYNDRLTEIGDVAARKGIWKGDDRVKVTCSLVKSIDIKGIPIPGLETIGNVLVIPHFGAVSLGDLEVGLERVAPSDGFNRHGIASDSSSHGGKSELSTYFKLTMLEMELGCFGHGNVSAASATANGKTRP
jgi:hypothetical protein